MKEKRDDEGNSDARDQSEDGENSTDHSQQQDGSCHRCLSKVCCKCFTTSRTKWPRTYSLCFGVILPLWIIIFVSQLFGHWLSDLEAPNEFDANDDFMQTKSRAIATVNVVSSVTDAVPEICAVVYFDGNRTLETFREELREAVIQLTADGLVAEFGEENPFPAGDEILVNTTDMLEFMAECGELAGNFTRQLLVDEFTDVAEKSGGITLNWIRCVEGDASRCDFNPNLCGNLAFNRSTFLPSTQAQVYANAWKANQEELFEEYFSGYLEEGQSPSEAAVSAYRQSTQDATGQKNCTVNTPAGSWFWFTVMSTIGYGNQAPVTNGGRAMILTLGFGSIMLFGGILVSSGIIVTAIFDDAIGRLKHADRLARPLWGSLLWGSLYYTWMLAIAQYYVFWQNDRLEEDTSFFDAFWFAFISTTTVGLGDFYLEPAVIQNEDLYIWSLLFLFGFVLLANFVTKFTALVTSIIPKKEFELDERLANTNLLRCGK